ncbi:hypothetical protein T484DRAFT_1960560 [Baffinella frigidus]|nr:hypothetical protein T484DRAFT_1960560 [Cryptophyta sp. CCMP2293]
MSVSSGGESGLGEKPEGEGLGSESREGNADEGGSSTSASVSSATVTSATISSGGGSQGVHVAGGGFGNGTDGLADDSFAGGDVTLPADDSFAGPADETGTSAGHAYLPIVRGGVAGDGSSGGRGTSGKTARQPVVRESSWKEARFSQKLLSEIPPEQLTLRELDDEVKAEIGSAMHVHKSFYNRHLTYMVVISLILGLCVVSVAIPSRFIPKIVNLGPSTDLSEFRQALVKSCVHLSRELVLDDGFSRMSAPQIAGTLKHAVTLLHDVDVAVRRGGAMDMLEGADLWSDHHNRVMYDKGCPWREDASNCSIPIYPDAASGGLYALSLQFMESVNTILTRYAPADRSTWESVWDLPEREALLHSDDSLKFVLSQFDGDLYKGYIEIVQIVEHEMANHLDQVPPLHPPHENARGPSPTPPHENARGADFHVQKQTCKYLYQDKVKQPRAR